MCKPENTRKTGEIAGNYTDISGQQHGISEQTRQLLLTAMGDNAAKTHHAPLPAVQVFTETNVTVTLAGNGDYLWTLTTEQGSKITGECSAGQSLAFPASLPQGYHSLSLSQRQQHWHCQLIIAPATCYQPDSLTSGQKLWGTCIQLYTLRSLNNWGIGDFADLQKILTETAHCGGGFVGLNPLHALYPAVAENASPYSPSSRQWLNIIYIDVNGVEDFQLSREAEIWWTKDSTQHQLRQMRDAELVDYSAVMALKLTALSIAWRKFSQRHNHDKLMRDFRQFAEQGGDSLYWHSVYDALHQQLIGRNPGWQNWSQWPAEYQHKESPQVRLFCHDHASEIEFYSWLQWLAQRQLAACREVCQNSAMPLGLYRDLAVGVAQYGAATWSDPELYCLTASIGAPPDPLGPQGQNWQLAPVNPHQLPARAYQPFIELLRANMRYCGALRIDHVMSLMRLWWIPAGKTATEGAYVHYPVDDLLAILALESQRHQCIIIGEDLGIVPQSLRDKLLASGICSYKVLYFETDQQQGLPNPHHWCKQALATVNTHDLPTLRGYWNANDLTLGKHLGIYTTEQLPALYQQRLQKKQRIVNGLCHQHCLPAHMKNKTDKLSMTPALRCAIYRYMASCHSALLGVQPEDWLDMAQPVNIPGTDQQYPNWRRKLSQGLDEIFMEPAIRRLLTTLNKYRKRAASRNKN